jgi:UTP--glucose-1-phosphate uridylyltransferase
MPVSDADVSKYGIADLKKTDVQDFEVKGLIEKPKPTETSSRWALPGRYVFDSKIFQFLETTKPGKNGEIQLTDAMAQMLLEYGMNAIPVKSKRFDAGDPLGFLKANIEMALLHPKLGVDVREYIKEIAHRL